MQDPYYVLFQNLNTHEQIKNLLDMQFHNVYILHNLQYGELKPFGLLCIHSKEPFLKHLMDKHVHTEYTQYKYHKFLRYVTFEFWKSSFKEDWEFHVYSLFAVFFFLVSFLAGAGFEPATLGLWAPRATRLLYPAILVKVFFSFFQTSLIYYTNFRNFCQVFQKKMNWKILCHLNKKNKNIPSFFCPVHAFFSKNEGTGQKNSLSRLTS